jgi:hypothetical protein
MRSRSIEQTYILYTIYYILYTLLLEPCIPLWNSLVAPGELDTDAGRAPKAKQVCGGIRVTEDVAGAVEFTRPTFALWNAVSMMQ